MRPPLSRFLLMLAVMSCAACGRNTEDRGGIAEKKRFDNPLSAPKKAPLQKRDIAAVCKNTPNPCFSGAFFELLGMLQEYNGRHGMSDTPPSKVVESFFYSENSAADAFERKLAVYEQDLGVQLEVKRNEGAAIEFHSETLSRFFNSFFIKASEGRIHTLDPAIIAAATIENKLRFIEGAYTRFGDRKKNQKSVISMANAPQKIETIARTLKVLGCPDVVVYLAPSIPNRNIVRFVPSAQLRKSLKIDAVPSEDELKGVYPNLNRGEVIGNFSGII